MNNHREDYILYRMEKSDQAFADALILLENKSWNACVNRLYYACYYITSALLLQHNIISQTHSGLKSQFNLHFIKTGVLSINAGKLLSDLMDWRQKGDYDDLFDMEEEIVKSLIEPVKDYLMEVKQLLLKKN